MFLGLPIVIFLALPDWLADVLLFLTELWKIIIEGITQFELAITTSFFLQILVGVALLFVGFKVIRKIIGLIKSFGA